MGEIEGTVLLTVAPRDRAAVRDLQVSIYASPETGEWIITVNDSGSNAPKVRQSNRSGSEWVLSWPKDGA